MSNLNEHAQMGSALASAFNRRETFLNGGTAVAEQKIAPHVIGNLDDFDLPECLKNLSLKKIFEDGHLSDDELEKLKKSRRQQGLPRHRAGRPALSCHRQGGAERPPRGASGRL